jgi:hypothetical protein
VTLAAHARRIRSWDAELSSGPEPGNRLCSCLVATEELNSTSTSSPSVAGPALVTTVTVPMRVALGACCKRADTLQGFLIRLVPLTYITTERMLLAGWSPEALGAGASRRVEKTRDP